jgi:hypothetical protein
MPFRKLPPEVQDTLTVHTAWLRNHSERLDTLESQPSKTDSPRPRDGDVQTPIGRLPLPLLVLCALMLVILKPELAVKLLEKLFGL